MNYDNRLGSYDVVINVPQTRNSKTEMWLWRWCDVMCVCVCVESLVIFPIYIKHCDWGDDAGKCQRRQVKSSQAANVAHVAAAADAKCQGEEEQQQLQAQ